MWWQSWESQTCWGFLFVQLIDSPPPLRGGPWALEAEWSVVLCVLPQMAWFYPEARILIPSHQTLGTCISSQVTFTRPYLEKEVSKQSCHSSGMIQFKESKTRRGSYGPAVQSKPVKSCVGIWIWNKPCPPPPAHIFRVWFLVWHHQRVKNPLRGRTWEVFQPLEHVLGLHCRAWSLRLSLSQASGGQGFILSDAPYDVYRV